GGTGVYTFPNTLTVTSSVTFLNSGFSVAVGTFVIDSSGYVGIGTATPLYPLHAVSNYNTDCFVFDGYSATGNEKDIFTIVDKDGGSSGGQDESSILKVLKENNWNNNDDGATLVELTYNAAVPSVDDRHFYMLGRAGSGIDEGIVSWGIALADSDFWTSGSIRAGATGKDMQGSGAAGFDSQTIALETSTHSYINTGSGFGLGTATPVRQMHIYGAGQEATDLTDSGNTGGTLYIQDSGSASNNGGAIIFGASQGYFAGIKSAMDDGTANTTGDLLFQTRNDTSDTSLTTRMYIKRGGQVGVGGDPGANDFRVMGGSNFIGVVTSTNTSNQVYAVYAP
ncbi:MAG: hypothetical protein JW803_08790, partial [Endomicrobiales bacterium]|nr:hypothetical protein [Endomicrobiales bacterium]